MGRTEIIRTDPGHGISQHGRTAYVGVILSASGSWAVVPVNLAAGKARAPMPTPTPQVAYMVLTLNGKILYVVHQDTGTVTPIHAATATAHAPIRLPGAPTAIAFRR